MSRKSSGTSVPARKVRVKDAQGRNVSLASLPLVAFALNCGHFGKEYAVQRTDLVFCTACGHTRKVARILAA